jgi:oligopeptide transport system substrate-binding protein
VAELTTAAKHASDSLGGFKESMSQFTLLWQGEIELTDDITGYGMEFSWLSGSVLAKAKVLYVMRGTQVLEVDVVAKASTFDSNKDAIDKIVGSFRLEEPRPFGVPRRQALTLYDIGPRTLDPAVSREATSHGYIAQIFSGLVTLDKDLKLVPDIAERWEVSNRGRTYTFYLRQGVTFHDGKKVTAQDFKYSWERAASPQTGSQTAKDYLGDIVGVSEVLEGRAREISGVRVIDERTLEVTIDAPKAYFLSKLTYPVAFVVDRANVETGGEWWRRPNGTGPFKLRDWQQDELIILENNPRYYGQPVKLGYVVYKLFGGIPIRMYETGEIDVTEVSTNDVPRVTDETNPLHEELSIVPELSVYYVAFNPTRPPFDDALIRRAFAMAVDTDKIIRLVQKGSVQRANGLLPPGLPGHNPDLRGIPFDPAQAKRLISQSKYGDVSGLPPITITTSGRGGEVSDIIGALVQEWRQNLGIEVMVRQLEPETYFYLLKQEKDNMFDTGWIADYPDPQNFLDVLFHSGSEANDSEYSNPELDALLERARVEQDGETRMKMYQQAEQMLIDDSGLIPLWFGKSYTLVKPHVKGYVRTPQGLPLLKGVTLELP